MLCYIVICKAPLTEGYSESLSGWQDGENKSVTFLLSRLKTRHVLMSMTKMRCYVLLGVSEEHAPSNVCNVCKNLCNAFKEHAWCRAILQCLDQMNWCRETRLVPLKSTPIMNLPSAKMRWEKALRRRGSDETDYRNLRTTVRRLCVEQILDRVRQATGQLSREYVEVNNLSSSKCADRDDRQIISNRNSAISVIWAKTSRRFVTD